MAVSTIQRITAEIIGAPFVVEGDIIGTSYLGTPIYDNLVFPPFQYEDEDGEEVLTKRMQFDTVLISVNQNKNVVITPIQGKNGSVKEYINEGDYAVEIDLIVDTMNSSGARKTRANISKYPEDDMKDLVEILRANVEIPVVSKFLNNIFDITDIVIMSHTAPQREGNLTNQSIRLSCIQESNTVVTERTEGLLGQPPSETLTA